MQLSERTIGEYVSTKMVITGFVLHCCLSIYLQFLILQ